MQNPKGEIREMTNASEVRMPLFRSEIIKVKTRALRRGVWYSATTGTERACIDLVIRLVERVRSCRLGKIVSIVLKKLDEAMESRVHHLMREIGRNLALKLSRIAQDWGHKSAVRWADDSGFIRYLSVACLNTPFGSKVR